MADIDIHARIVALEDELCQVLTSGGETRGIREQLAILHAAKARADADAAAVQAEAKAKAERVQQARISEISDRHAADAVGRIAARMAVLAAPPPPPSFR